MAERRSALIQKLKYLKVYTGLKYEILRDPAFENDEYSSRWIARVLDYFVPRGNLKTGLGVIKSYRCLKEGKDLTENEIYIACVLGWCIELLQAYLQAVDTIISEGQAPSDTPYRFELSKGARVSANDGIFIGSYISRILIKHIRGKSFYPEMVELINEAEFISGSGKMLNLINTVDGVKDLSKYSMPIYRKIVKNKTAYISYYLPVACALLMLGEDLEDHVDTKNILVEMGIYFQVKDDYLNCFGDHKKTGKVGTDIEEFKCTWLVVKALELCNEEQKKVLHGHYGKNNPESVAKVKDLYNELDLKGAFVEYEARTCKKLMASIESIPSKPIQAVLTSFLGKVYKRVKLDAIFSKLELHT